MIKNFLQSQLRNLTIAILAKYRPTVIGITGSMGKTSAKEAVFIVLKDKFLVRMSPKNYNSESGLPLSVIGATAPGHSLLSWLRVFWRGLSLLLIKDAAYPRILILEMGVDRPGDLEYLTEMARPDIALVTGVSYSHIEYFDSVANIKKEKQVLVEKVNPQGLVALNYDNEFTREMTTVSKARVMTYGFQSGANLLAQDLKFNFNRGDYELNGLHFKMNNGEAVVPVNMKRVMSESAVYAALAGAAVGLHFGMNLVDIAKSLEDFRLPLGRMSVLPGVKHTFIIDDTYNSSPEAVLAALNVLSRIKVDQGAVKYAVLGDMLELGVHTEERHLAVGTELAARGIDCLIAVGERSRDIIRGASAAGMGDEAIFYFDRPDEAGRFLQNRLKAGDIVLVKGSQGMRLEKIVKEIMAEPERASELLVRQDKEWQDK